MITKAELKPLSDEYNALISVITDDYLYPDGEPRLLAWIGRKTKTWKLPKNADLNWVAEKIARWQGSSFNNLRSTFEKLGLKGNIYYTSFGFSYDCFFKDSEAMKKETAELKTELDRLDIKYQNEYSDAFWVYRFRISQSKENLNKIEGLN